MEGGGQFFRPSTVTSVSPWISTASANLHMGSVGDFRELKGLEAWKHMYRHLSRLLYHWSLIPYFPVNSYYMDSLPYSDIQSLSWPGLNLLPACVYNFFPTFLTYQPDYLTVYTPKMVLFKLQSLATISGSSIRLGALQGVVQSLRCVWLSVTPWTAACQGKAGFPVLHYLPEFAQTHVHCVNDAIWPSHPVALFSSCLQSFPASGSFPMSWLFTSGGQSIGATTSAWVLLNEYSGLISFRID